MRDEDGHRQAEAAALERNPRVERFTEAARISQEVREHLLRIADEQARKAEPRRPLPTLYPSSSLNLRRAHARAIAALHNGHGGDA